jgi:hypothetical protein
MSAFGGKADISGDALMSAYDPKPTLQNGKHVPRIGSRRPCVTDGWRIITSIRRSRGRSERFAEIAAEFVNGAE